MSAEYVIPFDVQTSDTTGYGVDYAGAKRNPLVHSVEMSVSEPSATVRFTFYRASNTSETRNYIQAAASFRVSGNPSHSGYDFSSDFTGQIFGVYYVNGESGPFKAKYPQPIDCSDIGNSEFKFTFTAERIDADVAVNVAVNVYTSED